MSVTRWLPVVLVLASTACGDSTGPADGQPESELEFVRFPAAPPLESQQVSFWAVDGENSRAVLRYLPDEPGEEGEEFLEFEVEGNSLLRGPDGRRFERGDSILITVAVSADGRFLFDLQPSGLIFDPEHPARLRIRYQKVEGDLNGDGDVDTEDEGLSERIRVWKQEQAGQPWFPVGTLRFEDLEEIEGRITSFTGFCIAG